MQSSRHRFYAPAPSTQANTTRAPTYRSHKARKSKRPVPKIANLNDFMHTSTSVQVTPKPTEITAYMPTPPPAEEEPLDQTKISDQCLASLFSCPAWMQCEKCSPMADMRATLAVFDGIFWGTPPSTTRTPDRYPIVRKKSTTPSSNVFE